MTSLGLYCPPEGGRRVHLGAPWGQVQLGPSQLQASDKCTGVGERGTEWGAGATSPNLWTPGSLATQPDPSPACDR